MPGTYYINGTILMPSNSTLWLGANVRLQQTPNTNASVIRNANWGSAAGLNWIRLTSITTTDGVNVIVTSTAPHGLSTGNYVLINGAIPDDYNGVWPITVTGPTTFQYLRDPNTGGATPQFTSPATTAPTATPTANFTTGNRVVTSVSSMTNVFPGMYVSGTGIPSGARVDTVDSATQFTLTVEGTPTANGTGVTLTISRPLQCCLADANITICGYGAIDMDIQNQTTGDTYDHYAIHMRNLGKSQFSGLRVENYGGAAIAVDGGYELLYENLWLEGGTKYQSNGIHPCDGCGRDVTMRSIRGSTKDDFMSIIQKQYAYNTIRYMDAGWPQGDITRVLVDDCIPNGCLSQVKMLACPGLVMDDIVVRGVRGRSTRGGNVAATWDALATGALASNANGTVRNLTVDSCSQNYNTQNAFLGIENNIGTLTVSNCIARGLTGTAGKFMSTLASTTISRLRLINNVVDGNQAVACTFAGSILDVEVNGLTFSGGWGAFMRWESGATAGARVRATNIINDGSQAFISAQDQAGFQLFMANCQWINRSAGNWMAGTSNPQALPARFSNVDSVIQANTHLGWGNNSVFLWDNANQVLIASSATIAVDMLRPPNKFLTVDQNMTISNPSPATVGNPFGQKIALLLRKDATANLYTITWGANYVFPAGAFVQPGAAASTRTVVEFAWDGTSRWICTSGVNSWN